jgi:hypothetical protein
MDRDRFRSRARLKEEKRLRIGWEKRRFLELRFCCGRRKDPARKNLAGSLHTDGVECTLSVSQEVKMKIPVQKCDALSLDAQHDSQIFE